MATKMGTMERNHENVPQLPLEVLRMVIEAIVTQPFTGPWLTWPAKKAYKLG